MITQTASTKYPITQRYLNIILVEDEPVELEIYRRKLASWDIPMQLTSAGNGVNALLKISQTPPDMVITDLKMPIMDGFELLRMLRQSVRSKGTHFVVITSLPLDEVRQRSEFSSDITLISKPVDFSQLEQMIRSKADELLN